MFKIVQTIERGSIFLTTVPSTWEKDGFLFWPTSKKPKCLAKLLRVPDSFPETGWTSQECLKKREFDSFEAAEAEINRMESNSDTDGPQMQLPSPEKRKKKVHSVEVYGVDKSFVNMCKTKEMEITPMVQVPMTSEQFIEIDDNDDFITFMRTTSENIGQINEKLDKLFKELAKQQVFHEIYMDIISKINEKLTRSPPHLKEFPSELESGSKSLVELKFPINSEHELDEMELYLNDEKYMKDLIGKMKDVCGESGLRNPVPSSYQLVDRFFTRQFLLHVTWSGGSRCEEKKIGLKNFKNILSAFTSVIKLAAGAFDEQKCKDFFSVVLRNSKKRTENNPNTISRASTQKTVKKRFKKEDNTPSEPNSTEPTSVDVDVDKLIDFNL